MVTDADGHLASRFAALRNETDDSDWNEVLRRHKSQPRPRRCVKMLAIAVAVVAIGVPTAFAFGAVRDLFFGTPAPPLVKNAFTQQNEMRKLLEDWQRTHHVQINPMMPEVNGQQAKGVIAVNTSDGPLLLWAAPAADGKECWFVDFAVDQVGHTRPTGGGGCDRPEPPANKMDLSYGWSAAHPALQVLDGRIYTDATSLQVTLTDSADNTAKTYSLPVVDSYFLAAFPRRLDILTRVVARDTQGAVVAEYNRARQ